MPSWARSAFGSRSLLAVAVLVAWLAVGAAVPAREPARRPLDRIAEIGPAIRACWQPPKDAAGMELTLIFSFDRSGAILGKPRISYSKLHGDHQRQKRFVASVLAAIASCTPLEVTPSLGAAIAGRPFAIRFRARGARPELERRAAVLGLFTMSFATETTCDPCREGVS